MAANPLKKVAPSVTPGNQPLDLGLNDGTYASERCAEVLRKYNSTTAFRHFPSKDNRALREAIAQHCGVAVENIFVANGSGPLLKTCLPYVIETKIKTSPKRIFKHLTTKRGYPIITPAMTYFKVPHSAARQKLQVELIPLGPENGWQLNIADLTAALDRGDGLVYLANPNNPTGNVLVTREQVIPLMRRYPESTFVIDEAYVEYVPETLHERFPSLIAEHPNLMVLRTFSFAHGLAAARVGYIIARKELVNEFELKTTPHAVSTLSSDLAIASLGDPDHMRFIQEESATQRTFLIDAINGFEGVEAFPSQTNFLLCRFTDGRTGHQLKAELAQRGILIKVFEAIDGHNYDEYFRITIGLAEENQFLLEHLQEILA